MLGVKEVKGTVDKPDIEAEVNECLDKLAELSEDVEIYDIKYNVVQDIQTGETISSAMIIFFIKS